MLLDVGRVGKGIAHSTEADNTPSPGGIKKARDDLKMVSDGFQTHDGPKVTSTRPRMARRRLDKDFKMVHST